MSSDPALTPAETQMRAAIATMARATVDLALETVTVLALSYDADPRRPWNDPRPGVLARNPQLSMFKLRSGAKPEDDVMWAVTPETSTEEFIALAEESGYLLAGARERADLLTIAQWALSHEMDGGAVPPSFKSMVHHAADDRLKLEWDESVGTFLMNVLARIDELEQAGVADAEQPEAVLCSLDRARSGA